MSREHEHLAACLKAVTDRTPQIRRSIANARKSSRPITWRKYQLERSIDQTRALLSELLVRQAQLDWIDREGGTI